MIRPIRIEHVAEKFGGLIADYAQYLLYLESLLTQKDAPSPTGRAQANLVMFGELREVGENSMEFIEALPGDPRGETLLVIQPAKAGGILKGGGDNGRDNLDRITDDPYIAFNYGFVKEEDYEKLG